MAPTPNFRGPIPFLDASSHLYMRVCPSVRRSVGRSVGLLQSPFLRFSAPAHPSATNAVVYTTLFIWDQSMHSKSITLKMAGWQKQLLQRNTTKNDLALKMVALFKVMLTFNYQLLDIEILHNKMVAYYQHTLKNWRLFAKYFSSYKGLQ